MMGLSLADWLALREPFDAAARSATLAHAVSEALTGDMPLRIVDLGTGRGRTSGISPATFHCRRSGCCWTRMPPFWNRCLGR